ncbi:MAG: DUF5103 domain-containing protein [Ignavibacteriaceae bacterium]|nr:DUF5103 domain-containing protein [Ignavibacteriaceae bacterium]
MWKSIRGFKFVLIFSFFVCLQFSGFSQNVTIRSLEYYINKDKSSFPLLDLSDPSNKLNIEFDVASDFFPSLAIYFKFCDINWTPTNNDLLSNRGFNFQENLKYDFLPVSVNEAKYHFKGSYPDSRGEISFPFEGKWMFFISDSYDTSIVYATGKFYVVKDILHSSATVKSESLTDASVYPANLAKTLSLITKVELPSNLFPNYLEGAEIVQNRLFDYSIFAGKEKISDSVYFDWDGNRNFNFVVRKIKPGNEYRQIDLRNESKYPGKFVPGRFEGADENRFFTFGSKDLNGGMVISNFQNVSSEYLEVQFNLRTGEKYNYDVYLTGAFNNWEISPKFKMDYSNGVYSVSTLLKRGIYDYQYLALKKGREGKAVADFYEFEGNFLQTTNEYHIFIFYREQTFGGYDRIISHITLITGN